jgi:RimJ/RimL family protein N-acetyltransferase
MVHPYWPLFDLTVRTPRLEIRYPTDEDLCRLVALTDDGIHDPATMPFSIPWTDAPVARRHRESLQWWWRCRANWKPDDWTFSGAVFVEGQPVGVQDLAAKHFGSLRTVSTGSWLGRAHQGQGLGKEMRAAILHLAFDALGAIEAYSAAFEDNPASLGTSRALGYSQNGTHWALQRDRPAVMIDLRLDRATWSANRRNDIDVVGLDRCREMFGVLPSHVP